MKYYINLWPHFRYCVLMASCVSLFLFCVGCENPAVDLGTIYINESRPSPAPTASKAQVGVVHSGKVESISNVEIVLKFEGQNHKYAITSTTKILTHGVPLTNGEAARVWTSVNNEKTAYAIGRGAHNANAGQFSFQMEGDAFAPLPTE